MSHRINVMVDDETWGLLEKIPSGERSRTINEALQQWATRRRRRDAVADIKAIRGQLPNIATADVVRWIREERERDG